MLYLGHVFGGVKQAQINRLLFKRFLLLLVTFSLHFGLHQKPHLLGNFLKILFAWLIIYLE
jgi:hypothetical protein